MIATFVHSIDPIVGKLGPFYLWWYGLSYTFGFLGVFFWMKRRGMEKAEIYDLILRLGTGVLLCGRLVEVFFYEWSYYGEHLRHIPAVWLGGMSTHGILLGAALGALWHCRRTRRNFLDFADVFVVVGAYIMGVGRIGNFIDGQIVGPVTSMPWGVKFPDVEGFRHPVVLYDGIKNLLLVPILIWIRRSNPPRGVVLGWFLFGYGFFRFFIDLLREYRTDLFDLPPGQWFNIVMSVVGLALVWIGYRRGVRAPKATVPEVKGGLLGRRIALALLLFFPALIPSDWTQDVPDRYGARHPGMVHSRIYPPVDSAE